MDVKVSISKSKEKFDATKQQFFTTATGEFKNLTKVVTTRTWSPIVFKDGVRASANFMQSELVGIDIDEGMGLEEAIERFSHLDCIIGTTKSHGIEKKTASGDIRPPCDRFRIILRGPVCTNKDDYEYSMQVFTDQLSSDTSCTDAARLFFPCTQIVHVSSGQMIDWLKCPEEKSGRALFMASMQKAKTQNRKVPDYIDHWIRRGVNKDLHPEISRHETVYKIGGELFKRGFSTEEILGYMQMCGSPLLEYVGYEEAERGINGAVRKVSREQEKYGCQ